MEHARENLKTEEDLKKVDEAIGKLRSHYGKCVSLFQKSQKNI
jgi:hypothetical protein